MDDCKDHMKHQDVTVDPEVQDRLEKPHIPVVTPAGEQRGMLPGIAMISMYVLVLSMVNAFAAARGAFGGGSARYSILSACSLLVVGAFGLLMLRRWGWSLVTGGCLVCACGFLYGFSRAHIGPYLIQGLFLLVFFLYLVRTEVRERLK